MAADDSLFDSREMRAVNSSLRAPHLKNILIPSAIPQCPNPYHATQIADLSH